MSIDNPAQADAGVTTTSPALWRLVNTLVGNVLVDYSASAYPCGGRKGLAWNGENVHVLLMESISTTNIFNPAVITTRVTSFGLAGTQPELRYCMRPSDSSGSVAGSTNFWGIPPDLFRTLEDRGRSRKAAPFFCSMDPADFDPIVVDNAKPAIKVVEKGLLATGMAK